jgi:hypothetical protein
MVMVTRELTKFNFLWNDKTSDYLILIQNFDTAELIQMKTVKTQQQCLIQNQSVKENDSMCDHSVFSRKGSKCKIVFKGRDELTTSVALNLFFVLVLRISSMIHPDVWKF